MPRLAQNLTDGLVILRDASRGSADDFSRLKKGTTLHGRVDLAIMWFAKELMSNELWFVKGILLDE